jgi:hypothetical protein
MPSTEHRRFLIGDGTMVATFMILVLYLREVYLPSNPSAIVAKPDFPTFS